MTIRVVEIAPLRNAGEDQMIFDQELQDGRRRAVQMQPARGAVRHFRAGFGVFALIVRRGLADIMQQQREIQDARTLQALQQWRIMFIGHFAGFPNFIELFEADQRVFISGILMIKFVLHKAGQLAKFGNIFSEKIHLVHGAQRRGNFAAPFENGEKCFAHMLVVQKCAVHERQRIADQLRQVGMQLQLALLRIAKKRASSGVANREKRVWTRRGFRRQ